MASSTARPACASAESARLASAGMPSGAAGPAAAYLGPGLGAGTLAIILGFFASIFLALVAVFWYPIKRLIKGRKARAAKTDPTEER